MPVLIASGSRTIISAATVGIATTRLVATGQLGNLPCQHHSRGLKGGRRRREGRGYSTTSACSSPSPRSHDSASFGQIPSPPSPPPPPLSSLPPASASAPATPKVLGGIDTPPLTNAPSQLGNINFDSNDTGGDTPASLPSTSPAYLSRDIKQQEQEQISTSVSPSAPSQISSSPSIPTVPVTVTAEPATTSTTNDTATTQSQPSSSSSSSSSSSLTTPRSFRQIIKFSPIGRAADFYSRMQSRRPYWTQLWCTLFIYLCGDLSAQLFVGDGGGKDKDKEKKKQEGINEEEKSEGVMARYDPLRTTRHLTVGAVAAVPGYRWFMFLHNNFNFPSKPRFVSILTKVAINQACFTPVFNTYFFSMQSLLAGTSLTETWERLKLALPTSIMNSAKLWPAVTAFMFMYVDPQFRSIFAGGIAVGWQTYLSWLNQKAARDVEAAEAQALAVDAEGGMRRQGGGGVGATAPAPAAAAVATAAVSA
ncbi:hypothetical protein AJ78_03197 [Emergomyces pasteurianus Ep9510]|uniref:Uncharacterized protein n=1 Tax=Emergomyces pasteurianus Ep9510 TaxID=1447872 RepID=A0A1J9QN34_9EURO|nr:hypothetical protein AJ78_03197 [Emergomyces pasteurianus Ep9510]